MSLMPASVIKLLVTLTQICLPLAIISANHSLPCLSKPRKFSTLEAIPIINVKFVSNFCNRLLRFYDRIAPNVTNTAPRRSRSWADGTRSPLKTFLKLSISSSNEPIAMGPPNSRDWGEIFW